MKIQLVSNPDSGAYSRPVLDRLRAEFERQGAQVTESESSPRTPLLIDATADRLCVVGGDGTLRHAVKALEKSGSNVPLVAYPGGTVNLMQLELAYPTDTARFVETVLRTGQVRTQYAATLNDTRFLTCASIGPDSAAVAALSEPLKRIVGKLAYVIAFLGVLWRWPRPLLSVRIDAQRPQSCEAIYIAKGRHFAGPWSFAPEARQSEPVLHVIMLERLTRWRYVRFMLTMLLGRPVAGLAGITCHRCTSLQIEAAGGDGAYGAEPVQADGDIATHLPAHIHVGPETAYRVVR